MPANLTFIVQAAKRNAHVIPVHGLGNTLSQRCLSYPRRANKAQDGRLHIATQLQNGKVFENTFFHFLHAIVVFIQNVSGVLDVQIVGSAFVPGQCKHLLQIVDLHTVFRTLRVISIKTFHLFGEMLCH